MQSQMQRAQEFIGLAGRGVLGLVLGVIFGLVPAIQAIVGSDKSPWFWLFLMVLCFALVFARVGWRALAERDKAKALGRPQQRVGGIHMEGVSVSNVGGHGIAFAEPEWDPHTPMSVVSDRQFVNQSVEIDGQHFQGCHFKNVSLVFRGRRPFAFDANCTWAEHIVIDPQTPPLAAILDLSAWFQQLASESVGSEPELTEGDDES